MSIYKAAKFRFSRRRRAMLPVPATVQVSCRPQIAGLGKEVAAGGKPDERKSQWRKLAHLGRMQ